MMMRMRMKMKTKETSHQMNLNKMLRRELLMHRMVSQRDYFCILVTGLEVAYNGGSCEGNVIRKRVIPICIQRDSPL